MTVPKEAHSVLYDADGDPYEIWAIHGEVIAWMPAQGAVLGPEQQEQLGQAYIAACNAADRQGAASHG